MRCHWVKDKDVPGGKFQVPGCIGCAVYGPSGCTCGPAGSKRAMEQEIDELKERVRELETKIRRCG